jgi:hypothetical protein
VSQEREPVLCGGCAEPGFVRWIELDRLAAGFAHEVVVMLAWLAGAIELGAVHKDGVCTAAVRQHGQVPVDRGEPDRGALVVQTPVELLSVTKPPECSRARCTVDFCGVPRATPPFS